MTVRTSEGDRRLLAVMSADKDGVLDYVRHRDPDSYEVKVAGRRVLVPGGQLEATVAELRAVIGRGAGLGLRLDKLTVDAAGRRYELRVGPMALGLAGGEVLPWMDGLTAARQAKGDHAGEDATAELRRVLTDPDLADQCRLRLRAIMDAERISQRELARRVGHTDKTIAKALRFGDWFGVKFAEEAVRALGRRWAVEAVPEGRPAATADTAPRGEQPEVTRLRRLLDAHDRGWIRYAGPGSVNRALPAPGLPAGGQEVTYRVGLGGEVLRVRSADVDGWLRGVAAAHGEVMT